MLIATIPSYCSNALDFFTAYCAFACLLWCILAQMPISSHEEVALEELMPKEKPFDLGDLCLDQTCQISLSTEEENGHYSLNTNEIKDFCSHSCLKRKV